MCISDWSSDGCSSDLPDGAAVEINAQSAIDLSRETNGDVMLLATLRLDAAPSAPVFMSVRCDGADCGRPLRLPELAALSPGQWPVLWVPLNCFAPTGADTTRLPPPFRVTTRRPIGRETWSE